jgi:hypothetical protein
LIAHGKVTLMSTKSSPTLTSLKSRGFIVAGLVSIAITSPVLDAIQRNELYRHAAELGLEECLVLAILLTFVLTPLAIGVDRLVHRLARYTRGYGRNLFLFLLTLLAALACLRPVLARSLSHLQLDWLAGIVLAVPIATLVVLRIDRSIQLRRFLAVMAAGVVLFPASFTMQLIRKPALAESASASGIPKFAKPTNIVLVVFDELTATSLRSDPLTIDDEHFANFARLARGSTWYANATSSHARTDKAVPAILGSRVATEDIPPIPENYPDNLFQIVDRSRQYGATVFEDVTRLVENPGEPEPHRTTFSERVSDLIVSSATVYPRLILPADAPLALPDMPLLWQGIHRRLPKEDLRDGRISYQWCYDRDLQLNHFLRTIEARDRPHLWFLHSGLPHFPWCFAPDGRKYVDEYEATWPPPSSVGEIGEEWSPNAAETLRCEFRYRQQLGVIDHFIGQLQDRLKVEGIWDSCLLIVMADHGVCFRPDSSRRYPDSKNHTDLMNIPLFIKYPGQKTGRIDSRNVESIDILPTIADVLGFDRTCDWAGQSALGNEQRLRKSFRYEDGEVLMPAVLPGIAESVQRQRAAFGSLPLNQLPAPAMAWPQLLGRDLSGITVPDDSLRCLSFSSGTRRKDIDDLENFVPKLIQGSIDRSRAPAGAKVLVAAVDGQILESCNIIDQPDGYAEFHMMLPDDVADRPNATLELFAAPSENTNTWTRLYRGPL